MKQWHGAKLIILWLIGIPVSLQLLYTGRNLIHPAVSARLALGLLSIAIAIAVPATLLSLTWRWLSARELSPRSKA